MADVVARLDDWGRPAWITLMVGSFIFFWPIGLAVLAFLIGSGRMGCGRNGWGGERRSQWAQKMERWGRGGFGGGSDRFGGGFAPTGNRAFDEYRQETLKRLEEEASEFKSFLDRLRLAKDKAEFDQFMADRKNAPPQGSVPSAGV